MFWPLSCYLDLHHFQFPTLNHNTFFTKCQKFTIMDKFKRWKLSRGCFKLWFLWSTQWYKNFMLNFLCLGTFFTLKHVYSIYNGAYSFCHKYLLFLDRKSEIKDKNCYLKLLLWKEIHFSQRIYVLKRNFNMFYQLLISPLLCREFSVQTPHQNPFFLSEIGAFTFKMQKLFVPWRRRIMMMTFKDVYIAKCFGG